MSARDWLWFGAWLTAGCCAILGWKWWSDRAAWRQAARRVDERRRS